MSIHSTNSLQPARRQYFIKSDGLSRNKHKQTNYIGNNSEASIDELARPRAISHTNNPKTNDLHGILALALKESSTENNSPAIPQTDRSYFEVGRSMRRISLSQSGARIEKSLDNSCAAVDCPNRNIRIHYEELKNEYNDKIREIRRLTKLLEIEESKNTADKFDKTTEPTVSKNEPETVKKLQNEVDILKLNNKNFENDLNYANVMIEKLKFELNKKEEMLTRCQSYTDDQKQYIEATTKPNNKSQRDSLKTTKIFKIKIHELEKSNANLKSENKKLLNEIEDLKSNYTEVCLKFEKSELNRSKASGSYEKMHDKLVKDLQNEKCLLIEDIRALKEAHKRTLKKFDKQLDDLADENEELKRNLQFYREDSNKLKNAYEKLLQDNEELESANETLKAQQNNDKQKTDTIQEELSNLEQEMESLKVKYVNCNKEKLDIENQLYQLNSKIYNLLIIVKKDDNKSYPVDFEKKSIKYVSDNEINIIKNAILNYCSMQENNNCMNDKKDQNQALGHRTNQFNTTSGSMQGKQQQNETDEKLSLRLKNFVISLKEQNSQININYDWIEIESNEIISELIKFEDIAADNAKNLEDLQTTYRKLKDDQDRTGVMLNSLIDAMSMDIKRKSQVWTSFSPGLDHTNYALVCKLGHVIETYHLDHENEALNSKQSDDIPSPKRIEQDNIDKPPKNDDSKIKSQKLIDGEDLEDNTDEKNAKTRPQLLLVSHLMSNKETESLASESNRQPCKENEKLIESLRTENEVLKKQLAKLEAQDQSVNKTNDAIMMNLSPKGLISDENNGVDVDKLQIENEQLRSDLEAAINDNEKLVIKLGEISFHLKNQGIFIDTSDIYEIVNNTGFFPNKTITSDLKIINENAGEFQSDPENNSSDQAHNENKDSGFVNRKPLKTNTIEYNDDTLENTEQKETNDPSRNEDDIDEINEDDIDDVNEDENEFYAEFEDENEIRSFIEELIGSHKAKVEELELEIENLKSTVDNLEIDNKKLKLEINENNQMIKELECDKAQLAILKLSKNMSIPLKQNQIEQNSDAGKHKLKSIDMSSNNLHEEIKNLETLNNNLSTTVYKLTQDLNKSRQENQQLKYELETLKGRETVSESTINNSELLNSEVYQLNLSELNPNKAVAEIVQNKITDEDVIRLKDNVLALEEKNHNYNVAVKDLESKISYVEKENGELKRYVIELEKQIEILNEEAMSQNNNLTRIRSKMLQNENINDNNNKYASAENEMKRLQTQVLNLNETLFNLNKTNEQLMAESLKITNENKMLTEERKKLMCQLYKLSAKSMHKDFELEKKTYRLSNALIQVAVLKSELERLVSINN